MNKRSRTSEILITVFLFLLTANTLFPLPIDKLVLIVFVTYISLAGFYKPFIQWRYLLICGAILSISILGSVFNEIFDPMLYFPIVGIFFVATIKKKRKLEEGLYNALILHSILGLIVYVSSYFIPNTFVTSMASKGMPFVKAALGFTPTQQTFGTYCILWMMIYFNRKERGELKSGMHRFFYFITFLAMVATLNRSTFLFYLLIACFKDRVAISIFSIATLAFIIVFFQELVFFFFNFSTLDARNELLEGFTMSFWESGSIPVYLFGKGSVFVSTEIANQTTWTHRLDIENGYAFILHGYGFIGLFLYIVLVLSMVFYDLKKGQFYIAITLVFYMLFSTYFTQEFVSNSFYIMLAYLLYMSKSSLTSSKAPAQSLLIS
ncbi:hypothetical protein [Olivibacter domesticus]|uniref:O-antigen ligase like membrane protein n=1 Tax=Olivibacter domesticus TaxID=407022 RepID=A0A1H7UZC2_OLID1|nr:hypothetical protein [Olivibacter domesticus]SEM01978.1 hypothetical protein SAMN05661044_04004 [Olivibacter domesticus]